MANPVKAPPLPDFSTSNTSDYVKKVQTFFRLFAKKGAPFVANRATPRFLSPFLDYLAAVTDRAITTAAAQSDLFAPPGGSDQWRLDLDRWVVRLANYRREVATAIASGEIDSTSVVVNQVTAPLLLGIYSEPPPIGVKVDDGGQGILDAVTPVSLAHQADVTKATLDDAWSQLGSDLVESAKGAGKKVIGGIKTAGILSGTAWVALTAAGAAVLAIGGGTYLYFRSRDTGTQGRGGR